MDKNIKNYLVIISIFVILLIDFGQIISVKAQGPGPGAVSPGPGAVTSGPGAVTSGPKIELDNPIIGSPGSTTPSDLFSTMIKGMLGIVGTLSLVVFIYGGTLWLSSRGNPEQVKKGKDTFIYALVGLAVTFTSYAVLNLVITALTG